MSTQPKGKVLINAESDIVNVRKVVREVATQAGLSMTDVTRVVTAASELARNIFHYADTGELHWMVGPLGSHYGIELTFSDKGPGIEDVDQALVMGFTTRGGLGLGLPGAERLMDRMTIESDVGKGTTVRICKWIKQ